MRPESDHRRRLKDIYAGQDKDGNQGGRQDGTRRRRGYGRILDEKKIGVTIREGSNVEQKQEYKNIWVFIETEEGKAKPVGFELLTPGRSLADKIGEKLVAVIPGYGVREAARQAAAYGADEVLFIEGRSTENTERMCMRIA